MDNNYKWFALVIVVLIGVAAINDMHVNNVHTERFSICVEAGGAYDGESSTCTITK